MMCINLYIQNQALLAQHLHKFYNKKGIPWVNLIWNTYYHDGKIPHIMTAKGSFW